MRAEPQHGREATRAFPVTASAITTALLLTGPLHAQARPTASTAVATSASRGPADGVYRVVRERASAAVNAVEMISPQGAHSWAVVGARVRPTHVELYSNDNANTDYSLVVEFGNGHACGDIVVSLSAGPLPYASTGHGNGHCRTYFRLRQPQATRAAAALSVPRNDRAPAGDRVTSTFVVTPRSYRSGEAVVVALVLENPSSAPRVLRHVGGRQRGPRDNQFSFRIARNGTPVSERPGMDFGGVATFGLFEPGTSATLRAALASWGDVSLPGHYVVDCQYETDFSPEGTSPFDPSQRHRLWTRTFRGRVEFDVH